MSRFLLQRSRRLLPYAASLALLAGLLTLLDWHTIAGLFARERAPAVVAGALLFALSVVLRGVRFALLLPRLGRTPVGHVAGFELAALNNFGNHVLPMRMGELVFLFVASGVFGAPAAGSVLTLVSARLYDLVGLILLAAAALATQPAATAQPLTVIAAVALAGLVLVLSIRLDLGLALFDRVTAPLWRRARQRAGERGALAGWRARLALLLERLRHDLPLLRSPPLIALQLVLALAIWLCLLGCFHLLLAGFGMPLAFGAVVLGAAATGLSALLPVNTLGSIGLLEATWTFGFVAVGMRPADAVASGLAMHAIVIAVSGALAAVSLARLGRPTIAAFRRWRQGEQGTR